MASHSPFESWPAAGLVELGRKQLAAQALVVALDRRRQLAFALGGGLFVEFTRPQLGQQTGFFHRALEAAHRHFERLTFLDTNRRHKKYCPGKVKKRRAEF